MCAAGVLQAQTSATSIKPAGTTMPTGGWNANETGSRSALRVSLPTLGFLVDASGSGLSPIRGTASAPLLGDTIPKPDGVSRIYLPPRQHYALVEQSSSLGLAVWHLAHRHAGASGDVLDSIPGTLSHPDTLAFSPRGTAAALLSKALAKVQIVVGLPGNGAVKAELSTTVIGQVVSIAVSDDGQVLLAASSDRKSVV